jgi:hypothetical protein
MSLIGTETSNDVFFEVEYNTKLFNAETIDGFLKYFKEILTSIIDNPVSRLSEIKIISKEESTKLVNQFSGDLENE